MIGTRRLTLGVHWLFWLIAALIGFLYSYALIPTLLWMVVIFVSVLVHELGHAFTALLFGQSAHIQLLAFGGMTERRGPSIGLGKEFFVTFNGPLFGYGLAAASFGILHLSLPPVLLYCFHIAFLINLVWSTLNLLPILPLDGGHLLRIIMEAIFGAKGVAYALLTGVILGGCAIIALFILQQYLLGALLFLLTFESFRAWRQVRHLAESDRRPDLQAEIDRAFHRLEEGALEDALAIFRHVRTASGGKGLIGIAATEGEGRTLAKMGQEKAAYSLLQPIQKNLTPHALPLLQRLAYKTGDFATAVQVGKECYQLTPDPQIALTNAYSHAQMREAEPAIGWLKCAEREGLPNLATALQHAAFDAIREDPAFVKYASTLHELTP